ncbi:MAG: hypothetical protein EA376_13100 [Phycisphaeraceae bacterium]|nr:MAG: hypothetical protein EA376_13100 [Phycisphaeraceae bacterium]
MNDVVYDLTQGESYEVIAIEAGDYRILDDAGRPYLFPASLFKVIDPARPAHWASETLDGVEYASAPELAAPGFFEDCYAGDPDAVRIFNRYINRHLRLTDAA